MNWRYSYSHGTRTGCIVLASFLTKAAHVTKEVSSLIGRLMMRSLRALGKVVTTVKNITFSFIKWVLESLAVAMFQTVKWR